jgi:hypothetical protein
MTQGYDKSVVVCFYSNPRTGRVEKHRLPAIVFQEASQGRMVENSFVVPEDADLWSLEPPEGDVELDDRTPHDPEEHIPQAQPPPAFAPRSPESLKGRMRDEIPPVPPARPAPARRR